MPYYSYGYYGYGDFLANNLYFLLLIPVLLLSVWAQIQVSGSFRRYSTGRFLRTASGNSVSGFLLPADFLSSSLCC